MDEKTLELFNDSFETCVRQPGFLERFYDIFLEASPEVREKFKATDLQRQFLMIKKSLLRLTTASLGTEAQNQEIDRLGRIHGSEGLKIGARLYDLWLDSLLKAVSEFDPRWSPAVADSWRRMFGPQISKMKSYS